MREKETSQMFVLMSLLGFGRVCMCIFFKCLFKILHQTYITAIVGLTGKQSGYLF